MTWIVSVKRWQWVVVALIVGLGLGALRKAGGPDLAAYGDGLNDPKAFERGLVTDVQGRRLWRDVVVFGCDVDDGAGGRRPAYVVAGMYCPGHPDPVDHALHWRSTFFVADVPYRPATGVLAEAAGRAANGGGADAVARFAQLPRPTAVDYLAALKSAAGVEYQNQWWNTYPMWTWTVGSLLVIGLAWPTVVNLVAYGSMFRPPEEKGTDLSKVNAAATPVPAARPEVTAEDLARLEQMGAELEAELAAEAGEAVAPAPAATERSVRDLSAASEPVAAAAAPDGPAKAFGADAEDFYPTERHGHPTQPTHPPQPAAPTGKRR